MRQIRLNSFCSLFAIAACASATPAWGQDSGTDATAADDDNVIIVTAQLREEDIQDVPIAITALTGDDLAAARIEDVQDLQFNAPNVVLSANRNLTIRGVGSQSFGGSADTNIGVLVNGVFLQAGSTFGSSLILNGLKFCAVRRALSSGATRPAALSVSSLRSLTTPLVAMRKYSWKASTVSVLKVRSIFHWHRVFRSVSPRMS